MIHSSLSTGEELEPAVAALGERGVELNRLDNRRAGE